MKAILMTEVGKPEVLVYRDIDEPELRDDEGVKVRLRAAGVNPVDTKIRQGGLFAPGGTLPAVLGCDGAGEVVATGAKVTNVKVGDKVWFCHGGLGREQGNYTEFTVLPARWVAPMPTSLTFEAAAAAPLVLITAWGALFERGRLQAGQTVLVHGGTGGVGHVAIQLAKRAGATVLATVGSLEKAALAREWGADLTIDYRQEDFVEATLSATQGAGADLVLDCIGPDVFRRSIECTAHFGALVTLLDPGAVELREARARNLTIGFELMLTPMLRDLDTARSHQIEILRRCAEMFDAGRLHIRVSDALPLAEAARAHQQIETGHTIGKIVLRVD